MERYIDLVCGIADLEKKKRGSKKSMNICFDEWGVWSTPDYEVQKWVDEHPWQIAPPLGEQIYTMEDSLLFASMLMVLLKKCDRVKIGCQSLLVNISACIMTKKGEEAWVQPIYYPFELIANNAKGTVLQSIYIGETYSTDDIEEIPLVDNLVVFNEKENELDVFLVNRSEKEEEISIDSRALKMNGVKESKGLFHEDIKTNNVDNHDAVKTQDIINYELNDEKIELLLKPFSFQMVKIGLE